MWWWWLLWVSGWLCSEAVVVSGLEAVHAVVASDVSLRAELAEAKVLDTLVCVIRWGAHTVQAPG